MEATSPARGSGGAPPGAPAPGRSRRRAGRAHLGGGDTPLQADEREAFVDPTVQLVRLLFTARHLGLSAALIAVLVLPAVRADRAVLGAYLAGVLLPADFVLHAITRRRGSLPPQLPFVFPILASGLILLVPQISGPALLVLTADHAFASLSFGRRYSAVSATTGLLCLTAAVLSAGVPDGEVLLAGYGIGIYAMSAVVGLVGERERALRSRYGALMSEVEVIVWEMVAGSQRFSYVSPAAESLLGYPLERWYEVDFWIQHVHPDDTERVLAELEGAVGARVDHVLEYRMVHADGHAVHLRDVATVSVAGRAVRMRGVMMDISERRDAEVALEERATHDALTGLPNRRLFGDRVEQAIKESGRTGRPVALLLLDLDDFKEVNDTLGHDVGDRLLVAFAHRLRRELRTPDTIARLGGDEFAILLTTDADELGALQVANRVQGLLEATFDLDDLHLRARASIGIALLPSHANDATQLLVKADIAMYQAKRSGAGIAVFEAGADRASSRRLTLLTDLRAAIRHDALTLAFEPAFDLQSGRVASFEALARWQHPRLGTVPPEEFVRIAELSGAIVPLTRWVVESALDAYADAEIQTQLSINLSVRNLAEVDLASWLGRAVTQRGIAPDRLVVELTESTVMADLDAAAALLRAFRDLGVQVSVDDFGTGQSSFAYLKDLPLDELKLDRALVAGLGHDDRQAAICRAVVDVARTLGLRVVAEGAADAADVVALRAIACQRVQGRAIAAETAASGLRAAAGRGLHEIGEPGR